MKTSEPTARQDDAPSERARLSVFVGQLKQPVDRPERYVPAVHSAKQSLAWVAPGFVIVPTGQDVQSQSLV